jgi:hypothetical protein
VLRTYLARSAQDGVVLRRARSRHPSAQQPGRARVLAFSRALRSTHSYGESGRTGTTSVTAARLRGFHRSSRSMHCATPGDGCRGLTMKRRCAGQRGAETVTPAELAKAESMRLHYAEHWPVGTIATQSRLTRCRAPCARPRRAARPVAAAARGFSSRTAHSSPTRCNAIPSSSRQSSTAGPRARLSRLGAYVAQVRRTGSAAPVDTIAAPCRPSTPARSARSSLTRDPHRRRRDRSAEHPRCGGAAR